MPDLVLEVGTEEMPAGAIELALNQLKTAIDAGLSEARIPAITVAVCGTPRRLIVSATISLSQQPDNTSEVKGPSKSAAYAADGKPTGAALGFAKKQGVAVEDLTIISTPQGEYIQALVFETGKPVIDVIPEVVQEVLKSLTFPKIMRWGNGTHKFVRPVRWIVCMVDGEVADVNFGGITAGRISRGHRFLAPEEFEIAHSSELISELGKRFVMVDPVERRDMIVKQSNELAAGLGGVVPWDAGLLDENIWLVEWPTAVVGSFDAGYLDLPRPVLVTAMKKHQRYFPIQKPNGELLPNFIAIRSGDDANLDIVRDGYERVLAARFNDAKYFYTQDQASSLAEMRVQLDRLMFQEKLGNYLQKSVRLHSLATDMASRAGMKNTVSEAARLCKADLVSRMVVELPALQGIIGREYALEKDKESTSVADAIMEHYLPKFAGDKLPQTADGRLLAIADRMDTLIGYIGIGILPTGSSDPYSLRRAAQGLVQLLLSEGSDWNLQGLTQLARQGYKEVITADKEKLNADFFGLIRQRTIVALQDLDYRPDIVAAILDSVVDDDLELQRVAEKVKTLQSVSHETTFATTVQAAARVANILKSAKFLTDGLQVDSGIFEDDSEQCLYDLELEAQSAVTKFVLERQYDQVYTELSKLSTAVDLFFEKVMVMAEDAKVRQNRLALLAEVNGLYRKLADFTRIEC